MFTPDLLHDADAEVARLSAEVDALRGEVEALRAENSVQREQLAGHSPSQPRRALEPRSCSPGEGFMLR